MGIMERKQVVAIVGRVNVGKSSLFNRLTRKRDAITFSEPATTRDRIYGDVTWKGRSFSVIDTGGLFAPVDDDIQKRVYEQTTLAIDSADVILFVVDAGDGVTPIDLAVADMLRRGKKAIVLAANKIDKSGAPEEVSSFFKMGIGEVLPISATHNRGIDVLLNKLIKLLPDKKAAEKSSKSRIAIVGRPNVGKSSFVNALLRENRVIVDKKPGTTRDAVEITFQHKGAGFTLVDTGGLRGRTKIKGKLEAYSSIRGYKNIRDCDAAIVIIDAAESLTKQDNAIINYVWKQGKNCIIAVNKWDLIVDLNDRKSEAGFIKNCADELRKREPVTRHIPIIFISALMRHRVVSCIELARDILLRNASPIPTGILNRALEGLKVSPQAGRRLKIYYITQTDTKPPTFILFVNKPQAGASYKNYIGGKFREVFGFEGAPLRFIFRGKKGHG